MLGRAPFALVLVAASAVADIPMRRERAATFAIDPAFQDQGGVQYFFALHRADVLPQDPSSLASFKAFDVDEVFSRLETPPHVVLSRLVYTVDKDVSFFTERRARDVDYINAIATEARVSKNPDGTFRVRQAPANTFRLQWFDETDITEARANPGVARVLELAGVDGRPSSIVFQENRDFARVMGFRTAEGSFTWTAHFAVAPGRTRVVVFVMSYLASLPPFFLGGERRIFRESTDGARVLIERLRAFDGK